MNNLSRLKSNLKTKAIMLAVGILPVLAVGSTWYFANQAINRIHETREGKILKTEDIEWLQMEELKILMKTGVIAILAGALAAFWASRTIDSATLAARAAIGKKYQKERGERTHSFIEAIDRIRVSLNQEDIFRATVEEARRAIAADRVVIYSLNEQSQGRILAE